MYSNTLQDCKYYTYLIYDYYELIKMTYFNSDLNPSKRLDKITTPKMLLLCLHRHVGKSVAAFVYLIIN